jgi:hypothetical protein
MYPMNLYVHISILLIQWNFYLQINETWQRVYKIYFLKQNLTTCLDCRRFFYYYQKGFSDEGVRISIIIIDKICFVIA